MFLSKAAGGYGIKGLCSFSWGDYTINTAPPSDETLDAASDGVKKSDWSPSSDGGAKDRADEREYNRFTILPFCEDDISASVFHYFNM